MSAVIKVILSTILVINTFIFMKTQSSGVIIVCLISIAILIVSMITTFITDVLHSIAQIDKEDEGW